jgi:hypothetical protein
MAALEAVTSYYLDAGGEGIPIEGMDSPGWKRAEKQMLRRRLALIRDIFGNPFRPVAVDPGWLAWNGGCVYRPWRGAIHVGGRFADMPILADALEEAGCAGAALPEHGRGPPPAPAGLLVARRPASEVVIRIPGPGGIPHGPVGVIPSGNPQEPRR